MNKQQLAKKIWQSANKMRSKIEANEYKDYIIGFVFYKFLSDKEEQFLRANDFSDQDIASLSEEDTETVDFIKNGIGYFIAYPHLFSTWINKGSDFDISDVRDALSAFSRTTRKISGTSTSVCSSCPPKNYTPLVQSTPLAGTGPTAA